MSEFKKIAPLKFEVIDWAYIDGVSKRLEQEQPRVVVVNPRRCQHCGKLPTADGADFRLVVSDHADGTHPIDCQCTLCWERAASP